MDDMIGSSVDFRKTFDLNGTNNDEMLRLYLRAAGLSDDIRFLSPEQRRAFIYDIIKSKKPPGHWLPSTMKSTTPVLTKPFPAVNATTPPPGSPNTTRFRKSSAHSLSSLANLDTPQPLCYATINGQSGSMGNLQHDVKSSPILPQRFVRAPKTPPTPSTILVSAKGTRFEIGGPINFQHIAGDMTRDMSRNAFDLSSESAYDNVLNKYMKEHGITEDQIAGMPKHVVVRNIVQSKFTWMPNRFRKKPSNDLSQEHLYQSKYAAAETPSPQPSFDTEPSPPIYAEATLKFNIENSTPDVSNFKSITTRFADPSEFPSPESLFGATAATTSTIHNNENSEENSIRERPKTFIKPLKLPPPPPPRKHKEEQQPYLSVVNDYNSNTENVYIEPLKLKYPSPIILHDHGVKQDSQYLEPVSFYNSDPATRKNYQTMQAQRITAIPPPPPPPFPTTLNFANKSSSTVPAPPPLPPMTAGVPPPPPPPAGMLLQKQNNSSHNNSQIKPSNNGDSRDAFLESIRMGVTLKKVDQKAATISGVKPRAERNKPPPAMDFLSELKMGLTLRRNKNPENNPFAGDDPDESNA